MLNRRAFEEQLDLELERARRHGGALTVIVGDLDRFAAVNECQGHAAGDAALQLVASGLTKWKRRIDHAARIGGEEFALLLLPDTDEGGAFRWPSACAGPRIAASWRRRSGSRSASASPAIPSTARTPPRCSGPPIAR